VIPIASCPVLLPEIDFPTLPHGSLQADRRVEVAISTSGERTIGQAELRSARNQKNPTVEIIEGHSTMHYEVEVENGSIDYQVSNSSFWQSNVNAPKTLIAAVLEAAKLKSGDHLLDLYGGVGLFAGAALALVGSGGRIDIIEASRSATTDARENFADHDNVKIHTGDVEAEIKKFKRSDLIFLDPPRTGAGRAVIESMVTLSPRAIIYIACDPAALARDTGYLRESGYNLSSLRAFDLFPMTHHVESVALFEPVEVS
jgi:tRNA/tmRNA/rRNA uracil-C5-methylase (TrmA/RlmC/RlmD family)